MKRGLRTTVAAGAVLAFGLTGCTHSTEGSRGDASAVVTQSAEAMRAVTGLHLEMTVDGKVPNLLVTKLSGDISVKPATVASGTATVLMGGDSTSEGRFVYLDGRLYSDIAEAGKFTDYGDGTSIYNPATLLDPEKGLANLLAKLSDPVGDGTEDVNGVSTTKVTGKSSSDDVMVLAGSRMAPEKKGTMPTTVWIANDATHHLVKAQLTPAPDATVTLVLSEFDKHVEVSKPV